MGTTKLEKATRIVREYRELTEKEKSAAGSVLDEEERCSRALSAAHWIRRKRGAVLVSLDPSVEFAYFAAPAFGLWWLFVEESIIAFRVKEELPSRDSLVKDYKTIGQSIRRELGSIESKGNLLKGPYRILFFPYASSVQTNRLYDFSCASRNDASWHAEEVKNYRSQASAMKAFARLLSRHEKMKPRCVLASSPTRAR